MQVGSVSTSGTITYTTSKDTYIGKYVSGSYGATDAYISDVRIYNTTLSTDDVTRLYKHTVKITPEQNLIGEYFVEEGDQENINFLTTAYKPAGKNSGHGGTIQIEGNEIVFTATNGWQAFVLPTPNSLIGKNATLSFEYCYTNKAGLDYASGSWVHTTSGSEPYLIGSSKQKVYDTDVGV